MGILDLFSKRNKPPPDVVAYDELPKKLRVQIVHLMTDFSAVITDWASLEAAIAREHGLLELPRRRNISDWERRYRTSSFEDCMNYVLTAGPVEVLDLVEVVMRQFEADSGRTRKPVKSAIEELNARFRENGCGYQYERGQILREDSRLLHAETVKPALALLGTKGFEGPQKEFLLAHEHFRHGRIEDAMTNACKAFESVMKAICDARKWKREERMTARPLIQLLLSKGLVPKYSEEQLTHVEKCLQGVATLRSKDSAHGAGSLPRDVPEHYAAYALHLAASNIVFLVKCHEAQPK